MLDFKQNDFCPRGTRFRGDQEASAATLVRGDYAVVGITLQLVGERLCEAVDLRADERVIDVAAGNGNATACGRAPICGGHLD